MKIFIKDWLANFALIVLSVYGITSFYNGLYSDLIFILQLFFTTLVIRLLQIPVRKYESRYPFLEYLLEFGMVVAVVLGLGLIFGWHSGKGIPLIILTIIVAYAAAYLLDLTRTNKDIAYINEQIKKRRENDH